jgi:hypothetical protein
MRRLRPMVNLEARMIDWQSHMTPEEAAEYEANKRGAETFEKLAKRRYHRMRLIAQRCRQRARKAKGE